MSSAAAILCTKCGTPSPTPVSTCGKCGGRNARVCGACGFQNSIAKNYCDKCGTSIAELGASVAPPPAPGGSDIPQTVVRKLGSEPADSPGLPQARQSASIPGDPASLPGPGRAADPVPYSGGFASADPWSSAVPPPVAPPAPRPRWERLRLVVNAAAGLLGVLAAAIAIWYWYESRKPEVLLPRLAAQYLDDLSRRDFDAAYAMFSDSAKKNCTPEEFKASRDATTWTWKGLRIIHQEPGAVLLRYELTIAGAPARPDFVLFAKEGERWVRPYNWVLMRKVEEAFDKRDPDQGLLLAQAAALVNPRDPMARGYLCEAAYYRKLPDETVKQCLDALQLSQVYPSNLSDKSLYHLHAILADSFKNALRQPDKALDQYTEMLSFPNISPADQCEILLARSEAYYQLGRPGESAGDLDRAEQLCVKPADHAFISRLRDILKVPGHN